jgi:hypothetical protein
VDSPGGLGRSPTAGHAEAIRQAGVGGVLRWLDEEKLRAQARTVERLVAWAGNAAAADPLRTHLARVWQALYEDWQAKTRQIQRLEQDLCEILVKTPYVLLLSHPGITRKPVETRVFSWKPEFRLSKYLLALFGAKKYPLHCLRQGSQNGEDTHGFYGIVLRRG